MKTRMDAGAVSACYKSWSGSTRAGVCSDEGLAKRSN